MSEKKSTKPKKKPAKKTEAKKPAKKTTKKAVKTETVVGEKSLVYIDYSATTKDDGVVFDTTMSGVAKDSGIFKENDRYSSGKSLRGDCSLSVRIINCPEL